MINELLFLDTVAITMLYNRYINTKELSNYELRVGYKDYLFYKKPIVINMKYTPHIFVSGLSNQGKSKCVEYAVKGKNVVLLNCFKDDFTSLNCDRVNGIENILSYLNKILSELYRRENVEEPLYLVIDELLVLSYDKRISNAIFSILATGKHYNVYVIGISQSGAKESVKFKDLFNTRICFRQVEESSYRTVLGYSPNDKHLIQREFFLYSHETCRGYTYDI